MSYTHCIEGLCNPKYWGTYELINWLHQIAFVFQLWPIILRGMKDNLKIRDSLKHLLTQESKMFLTLFPNHFSLYTQIMSPWLWLWATPPARRWRSGSAAWIRRRCWIWASPSGPSCSAPPPCHSGSWWTGLGHAQFDWWAGNGFRIGTNIHIGKGMGCLLGV